MEIIIGIILSLLAVILLSKRKSKLQLAVEEEIITPLRKRRSYIFRLCSEGKFYRRYNTDPDYLCSTGCIFIDSVTLECKHPGLGLEVRRLFLKVMNLRKIFRYNKKLYRSKSVNPFNLCTGCVFCGYDCREIPYICGNNNLVFEKYEQ